MFVVSVDDTMISVYSQGEKFKKDICSENTRPCRRQERGKLAFRRYKNKSRNKTKTGRSKSVPVSCRLTIYLINIFIRFC